jgi:hypothetical protein
MERFLQFSFRIIILILLTFGVEEVSFALFGPGQAWQYVRKITLSSPAATPSPDFQVKVILTTAIFGANYTNINADASDLRFYDANNNPCSYYLDTWVDGNASNTVWVKVPVTGTGALYMYYGNSSASAVSNGDNTYIFFDDFPGTSLDGTKWGSYNSGTGSGISVSGGNVTLNCGTSTSSTVTFGGQIIGKTSFNVSDGVIIETKLGAVATNLCGSKGFLCGASSMVPSSTSFCMLDGGGDNYAAASVGRGGSFGLWAEQGNGTTNYVQCLYTGSSCPGAAGGTLPSGDLLSVTFSGSNIFYSESTKPWSVSSNTNPPSGTVYPILSTLKVPNCMGTVNNPVTINYIRLRKYSSGGDPAATFGSQVSNNLSATISGQTNVLCYGQSDGNATVNVTGGTIPYTYSWSTVPVQSTQTASGLHSGSFDVTVTESGLGLQVVATATISQPPVVSATINNQHNLTCYAGGNGTIQVTASGGNGTGYQFSSDNGITWLSGTNPYTFTGLSANVIYKVRVKDSNGCMSPALP